MDSKWKQRWLKLAHEVASWSKDSVQVGAIIFDHNRNPRGFGYNGQVRGLDDNLLPRWQQPLKPLYFEHAERNVIYACARNGISCDNCTMVVTHWPCCDCTRAIIQCGIQELIVDQACMDPQGSFFQKWQTHIHESQQMLQECGIAWHLAQMKDT